MKNHFLAALLLLVSFKRGTAQQAVLQECASSEDIDLQDLPRYGAASEDKVSDNYKCFIKCVFETAGVLSNGKLYTGMLRNSDDPNIKIIINCDKAVHQKGFNEQDACDYGYKLGRCMFDSLKVRSKQQETQHNVLKGSCASRTEFDLSELEQLKANEYQNAKPSFKCFQNCMFEQKKILRSGRLNRDLFKDQHNGNALYNRVKNCHVDIYEKEFKANAEECEFAYQLLLCLRNSYIGDQKGAAYDDEEIL